MKRRLGATLVAMMSGGISMAYIDHIRRRQTYTAAKVWQHLPDDEEVLWFSHILDDAS